MRLRNTIICSICIIIAASLLIAAGMQLDYINSQRQKMKLISNEPLENAPPSLAFATIAMGAFRGLVVDILWMRADRLKDQGQFFDAKQLAEWITTLQPRFAKVWEFQAWNMAYNISVVIPATQPDQRWHWIKNGYELLRDRGIPLNPKNISLYRELARIFQHKIASVSDDAHKYYKLQLAMAMKPLIGPADNQYFKALAEAPTRWSEIIADPKIKQIVEALKSADTRFANDSEFVNNYLSLRQNPGRFNPDAFKTIDNFRGTESLKQFDIFAKSWHLRKTWKLEPVLMHQLNKLYGPVDFNDPNIHFPLDWRHPNTHALYWAVKGLQMAGKNAQSGTLNDNEYPLIEVNTDRLVNHCLQNLFRNGKIFIYDLGQNAIDQPQKTRQEVFLRSDLRMFEAYNKSTLARIEKYKNIKRKGSYKSLQDGHRNMLRNALFSFYQAGHKRYAQKIYNQLRELYPADEFKVPLAVFAKKRLREELENIGLNNAKEIVQMMLRESYFRYALRDDDEAFSREKMAREVYDHYQSAYFDQDRIDLPDFKLLRYFALLDFFNDQQFPLNLRQNLLGRIKIERPKLAEQLKQQEEKMLKELK